MQMASNHNIVIPLKIIHLKFSLHLALVAGGPPANIRFRAITAKQLDNSAFARF